MFKIISRVVYDYKRDIFLKNLQHSLFNVGPPEALSNGTGRPSTTISTTPWVKYA